MRPRDPLRRLASSLRSHTRPTVVRRRSLTAADPTVSHQHRTPGVPLRSPSAWWQHRRDRWLWRRRAAPGTLGIGGREKASGSRSPPRHHLSENATSGTLPQRKRDVRVYGCVLSGKKSRLLPVKPPSQILLYPQDNLSPVLCHAPVSRAWWTSSTGHVTVTRAVPRQWWSTWPEGHSRGMVVVATSKGQSRPPGRRPLLAYSNPSPSSHGSEMVKSDRRGLILTKPNQKKNSEDTEP